MTRRLPPIQVEVRIQNMLSPFAPFTGTADMRHLLVLAMREIKRLRRLENTGEAEELRKGVEKIMREADSEEAYELMLQRLLDEVDARDSLRWLEEQERSKSKKGGR